MACPNCGSHNIWDDNMHWGCNKCKWTSLAGLNKTRTPSNPNNSYEVEARNRDWRRLDEERAMQNVEVDFHYDYDNY